jgi:autotransporter-associated beta strand protein
LHRARLLLAACAIAACPSLAMAGATFAGSKTTAKWTFDPDTSGGSQLKTLTLAPPPVNSSMPVPSSYQIKQTFTNSGAASNASGSIGYILNSTTASFTLAAGTGVTQNDPNNNYRGDSLLRVDFDGWFNPTSPSFGPPATGYVSIAVGGVVGSGGHSQFVGKVDFLNGNNNNPMRGTVNFNKTFSSVGNFAQTFTSSALLNGGVVPVGTPIRVKGFFEFRASNAEAPSSMMPLNIEFGNAPPTATWYSTSDNAWSNQNNWRPPEGTTIDNPDGTIPTIPDGAGQRARIVGGNGSLASLALDKDITLGAIDFDTTDRLSIGASGRENFVLKLDSGSESPASISGHTSLGDNSHSIDVPLQLVSDLEVNTDGTYQGPGAVKPRADIQFNQRIDGDKSLIKRGRGSTALNENSGFTGGTRIEGGILDANVAGSLGTGNVLASNGLLNYNAVHAADTKALISADDGGQINLGVVPAADEQFSVGSFGILSGNPAELRALSAAENGNLHLTGGATIAHESFDPTLLENNPQGLGTAAQYIFGIAADVLSDGKEHIIEVGSKSSSPWMGFGSDRFDRYFGTKSDSTMEVIRVLGDAELRSLDETLVINGQIESADSSSTLTKTGAGAVALNGLANSFRAPILVKQGQLLLNGILNGHVEGLTNITVDDGASFGGRGMTDGSVEVKDDGRLEPGDNTLDGHIGTLTMAGLKLSKLSQLIFELDNPDVVGSDVNDLIVVNGDLTLNGTINVFDAGDFSPGMYTLIQFSGDIDGDGVELNVANLPDYFTYELGISPSILTGKALNGEISPYNALTLTVSEVPEPTGALAMVGLIGLASARAARRRGRAR